MAWLVSEVQGLLDKKLREDSIVGPVVRAAEGGLTLDVMLDFPDAERWRIFFAHRDGVRAALTRIAQEVEVIGDIARGLRDGLDN